MTKSTLSPENGSAQNPSESTVDGGRLCHCAHYLEPGTMRLTGCSQTKTPLIERRFLQLVPMAGIELATFALRMRCSTN